MRDSDGPRGDGRLARYHIEDAPGNHRDILERTQLRGAHIDRQTLHDRSQIEVQVAIEGDCLEARPAARSRLLMAACGYATWPTTWIVTQVLIRRTVWR